MPDSGWTRSGRCGLGRKHRRGVRTPLITGAVILAGLLAVAGRAGAFDFSAVESRISSFTLDNGMTFLVAEDHSAPVVNCVTLADVGAANDPKEFYGLAHMFEHMAFKGTPQIGTRDFASEARAMDRIDSTYARMRAEEKKGGRADTTRLAAMRRDFQAAQDEAEKFVEPNQYANLLEQQGGTDLDAGTAYDNTIFSVALPSNKVELWFAMESDRFTHPVFREFYKERDVVKEERRMRVDSSSFGRVFEEFLAAAFMVHPYGEPAIGPMSDIDNLDLPAARAFYAKYYVPSNLIVALSGDVDPKTARALAEKYFGALPKAPKPLPLTVVEPKQNSERRVAVFGPEQPVLLIGYHRPAETDPRAPAFDALADYLGQGRTSLLYTRLVKELKIATRVFAMPNFPGEKYPALFVIWVMPAKGVSADSCEKEVYAQINRLTHEPIPADKLEGVKTRARSQLVDGLSSRSDLAEELATSQQVFGDWRELFKDLDRLDAVTAADIQHLASEFLVRSNRTVAYLETENTEK